MMNSFCVTLCVLNRFCHACIQNMMTAPPVGDTRVEHRCPNCRTPVGATRRDFEELPDWDAWVTTISDK